MGAWKIKTKRDWCIAFLFAVIIVYGISMKFSNIYRELLLPLANHKMTNLNYHEGYGNWIVTSVVMTLIILLVMAAQKPLENKRFSLRRYLAVLGAGTAAALLGLGAFIVHSHLIVSSVHSMQPLSIAVSRRGYESVVITDPCTQGNEDVREMIQLCVQLEEMEPAAQKEILESGFDPNYSESDCIWITYPKRFGHSYDLVIHIQEGIIYIGRGYDIKNQFMTPIYEDNGILEKLEKIVDK